VSSDLDLVEVGLREVLDSERDAASSPTESEPVEPEPIRSFDWFRISTNAFSSGSRRRTPEPRASR
jgi:hypothetical protein